MAYLVLLSDFKLVFAMINLVVVISSLHVSLVPMQATTVLCLSTDRKLNQIQIINWTIGLQCEILLISTIITLHTK